MTYRPNGTAPIPDATWRFGAQDGAVSRAWQDAWDRLSTSDPRDGRALAEEIAKRRGISPESVITMLHRMARAGLITRERRDVETTYTRPQRVRDASGKLVKGDDGKYVKKAVTASTTRARTFYRIAS